MPRVLAIDIGTSSIRATIYGAALRPVRAGAQVRYRWHTGSDGSVEAVPAALERAVAQAIDTAVAGVRGPIDAVAIAAFWHSLLGVDAHGRALTAVLPWSDTRSAAQAMSLRERIDERAVHARTGCRIHPTYWPAKLTWFADRDRKTFRRVHRWLSFPAYLESRWLGRGAESVSQASATGLYRHDTDGWDADLCGTIGIDPRQLAGIADLDDQSAVPTSVIARRWPQLARARWIPAAGDGALNNVGAGCTSIGNATIMIGTSGALRQLWTTPQEPSVPLGLWRYWLDRRRVVVGGALSNGGNFAAWMRQTFGMSTAKDSARIERAVARIGPDAHGLTVLPFLAGERSPDYPPDAFATIAGLRLSTSREDIFRAGLEGIAYRFREVLEELVTVARIDRLIASGTALTASRVWPQILADVIGCSVAVPREPELTSRGAAAIGFELLGQPRGPAPTVARTYHPDKRAHAVYVSAAERQRRLLRALC